MLALAATIVAALAVALHHAEEVRRQATIIVDARDEQTIAPRAACRARERAGYIATQIELIQSGKVATQVVRDLKLAQKPGAARGRGRTTPAASARSTSGSASSCCRS